MWWLVEPCLKVDRFYVEAGRVLSRCGGVLWVLSEVVSGGFRLFVCVFLAPGNGFLMLTLKAQMFVAGDPQQFTLVHFHHWVCNKGLATKLLVGVRRRSLAYSLCSSETNACHVEGLATDRAAGVMS